MAEVLTEIRPVGPGNPVQPVPNKFGNDGSSSFTVPDPIEPAKFVWRHRLVLLSFVLVVLAPLALAAHYLWGVAADQYASRVAFSVRQASQQTPATLGSLGGLIGLTGLSGSASDDAAVLNEYLRSQDIVAELDAQLDLERIWSGPQSDFYFSFDPARSSIEDLHRYWSRMVRINYDAGPRMLNVEVRAFDPMSAHQVARAVFEAGSAKINHLSSIAREDTIRFAQVDLDEAEGRLSKARQALTTFRNRTQIVDPSASLQGQMGLLGTLQEQLAVALINHDMLIGTTGGGDPRLRRLAREIEVIEARISAEKSKLGLGSVESGDDVYATLVGEYERLSVERSFAEEAYVAARAALDHARAEARRQTRYLAAHVRPTIAETARYPRRGRIVTVLGIFLFLGWALSVLTVYSIMDRR